MGTVQEGETIVLDVNGEKLSFVQVKDAGYAYLRSELRRLYKIALSWQHRASFRNLNRD